MVLLTFPVVAQNDSSNYIILLASGFLCDSGDSSICPATARSNQGDSYELSGAGMFNTQNNSVKATGTYTHKSPNGNTVERGVWLARELLKFDSYGTAPDALGRPGIALAPVGPKRFMMPTDPMPTGGLAVFRIRLVPMRGPSRTAVLQVNCALGDVPRERSVEGIRLVFEDNGNDFSEEVGGGVMFLSMGPRT